MTPSGKAGLALLRAALAEPAAPRPPAAGPANKIGQVVQVYSKSAKDWVDAKVISIENGLVAVNYSGPDGTMMSKTLRETDKNLRLKKQATGARGGTGPPVRPDAGGPRPPSARGYVFSNFELERISF